MLIRILKKCLIPNILDLIKIPKLIKNRLKYLELTQSTLNINIRTKFLSLYLNYYTFVPYKPSKHNLFKKTMVGPSVFSIK